MRVPRNLTMMMSPHRARRPTSPRGRDQHWGGVDERHDQVGPPPAQYLNDLANATGPGLGLAIASRLKRVARLHVVKHDDTGLRNERFDVDGPPRRVTLTGDNSDRSGLGLGVHR
jgi:hypothetical protein